MAITCAHDELDRVDHLMDHHLLDGEDGAVINIAPGEETYLRNECGE